MLCDLGQITESLWASGLLIYKMGRMIVISLIIAIRLLWKLNENTCKPNGVLYILPVVWHGIYGT